MNTSRVPGVTRNSGWRAVDVEIAAHRIVPQPSGTTRAGTNESKLLSPS